MSGSGLFITTSNGHVPRGEAEQRVPAPRPLDAARANVVGVGGAVAMCGGACAPRARRLASEIAPPGDDP